jgi:hypothetical protein
MMPYVKIKASTLGTSALIRKNVPAIRLPVIVITLQPYLFTRAPTNGPVKGVT